MIYVLYGEENFLMDRKIEQLKKTYPIELPELNEVKFDFLEHDLNIILKECETVPFFSDYRFIIFKEPYFLTAKKVRKPLKDDEIALLMDTIFKGDDSVIYIFYQYGKLDERKKIVKRLRKEAQVLEFKMLNEAKLRDSIRNAFKTRQVSINDDALNLFLRRVPHQLINVVNEVDKLALTNQKIITKDLIEELISKPIEENAFELSTAILNNNQSKAIEIYKDLMLNNEEPIKLIVMIANALRLLYQVIILDRKGYNDQEIAKLLGINPYRLRYIRQDNQSYQLTDLIFFMNQLAILDTDIKTGKIDKKLGFELFLMKLSANKVIK